MHENEKNNAKGRVKQTYRLRERETLQEFWRKTTKKNLYGALPSQRERKKVLKSFEKMFEQVKTEFLKNLIHDVQLIEKQVRLIEPDKGSLKILKRISIDRKIDWIN